MLYFVKKLYYIVNVFIVGSFDAQFDWGKFRILLFVSTLVRRFLIFLCLFIDVNKPLHKDDDFHENLHYFPGSVTIFRR